MNAVLADLLETGQVTAPNGSIETLHCGSIPRAQGEFLQRLIRSAIPPPKVTLEVGLAHGISALFICEALQQVGGTRHFVIDPYQIKDPPWGTGSFQGLGLRHLERAGYASLIDFRGDTSDSVLPQLVAQKVRVDFAFIDGFHTFDHTLVDFFFVDQLLRPGGIVALDDTDWPSVHRVCRFIATNRQYRIVECLPPTGRSRRRSLRTIAGRIARPLRGSFVGRNVLHRDLVESDETIGFLPGSRCVAFQKVEEDRRRWDAHHDF